MRSMTALAAAPGPRPRGMGAPVRSALLAVALGAAMAGCALTGGTAAAPDGPGMMRPDAIRAPAAQALLTPGKTTKAEVRAAIGPATTIPFDSGYEIWVYRWPGAQATNRAATELVILFEPSGTVKKTRVRPGYGPGPS